MTTANVVILILGLVSSIFLSFMNVLLDAFSYGNTVYAMVLSLGFHSVLIFAHVFFYQYTFRCSLKNVNNKKSCYVFIMLSNVLLMFVPLMLLLVNNINNKIHLSVFIVQLFACMVNYSMGLYHVWRVRRDD